MRPLNPQAFLLRCCNLVADALPGDLPLELGEREKDIEGQPPHGSGGVEALCHRDEGDLMGIEELHQLGKVGQRPGQPIHLIDDDDIQLPGPDISEQLLQSRPFQA